MALLDIIPLELGEGKIIRLGKLGSFSVLVNSEGSDTPEEVGAANIKTVKIRYIAGKELKTEARNFSFVKQND